MPDVNIFSNSVVAIEGLNTQLTFTVELSVAATTATTYYLSTVNNTAVSVSD